LEINGRHAERARPARARRIGYYLTVTDSVRTWGRVTLVIALVGCGGGTGASSDGGAGRGGASAGGGAIGVGGHGTGGDGAAGMAAAAGTTGTTGTAGASAAAGVAGTAGVSGAAGINGAAGHAAGVGGMNCRPDVLLVQDKSGSMSNDDNDQACNGGCAANSKWSQMTMAVTNVLGGTDVKVNWGLKYFPNNNACDASATPAVGIAANNATAVVVSLAGTQPGGDTPTRDAVTFGAAYLQTLTDTNPKFLVLATDGQPNCPAGCAPMATPPAACTETDNPTEDAAAEAAVMMAASQGIRTFVIGIGNVATAQNTLNQLAIEGGEAQTGTTTSYYAATDEASFELALNSIVKTIAGCPH
jgi:von Willebrand factor type A domain